MLLVDILDYTTWYIWNKLILVAQPQRLNNTYDEIVSGITTIHVSFPLRILVAGRYRLQLNTAVI